MSRAAAISRKVREFIPKSFAKEVNPPKFLIKSVPEEDKYTLMAGIADSIAPKFIDQEVKDEPIGTGDGKKTVFDLKHINIDPETLSIKVGAQTTKGEIVIDELIPKLSLSVAPKEGKEVVASYKYRMPVIDAEWFNSLAGDAKNSRLAVERLVEKGYISGWSVLDADNEDLPFSKENVIYLESGLRTELVMELTGLLTETERKNLPESLESTSGSETTKTELGSVAPAATSEASQKTGTV